MSQNQNRETGSELTKWFAASVGVRQDVYCLFSNIHVYWKRW